jgi:hypothetical protein
LMVPPSQRTSARQDLSALMTVPPRIRIAMMQCLLRLML